MRVCITGRGQWVIRTIDVSFLHSWLTLCHDAAFTPGSTRLDPRWGCSLLSPRVPVWSGDQASSMATAPIFRSKLCSTQTSCRAVLLPTPTVSVRYRTPAPLHCMQHAHHLPRTIMSRFSCARTRVCVCVCECLCERACALCVRGLGHRAVAKTCADAVWQESQPVSHRHHSALSCIVPTVLTSPRA